ncbi:Outer membrane receptor proteins, mostly Fe transport [Methylophilus rhizosphaerae]|uniref:Outer membrane receptor proteins, mostly Fe transport n=1 Tax=Methylophilus rhizosphaerae TaxID=492660 RepID=A0A1G8ZG08_9PROT|nr:TonB-dependent receptor [Methylophilus rhizosphaerae]SDK14066.1 Outer membrane receptor proteins, mostly Fe transport [Methylophilus rhizosphaerae]
MKVKNIKTLHTIVAVLGVVSVHGAQAEVLNTQLPKQQEETFSVPVNIDIPRQPLANSLHDLGKSTGMSISFPNDLVAGKTAPEVRGRMTRQEALRRVLGESGLISKNEGDAVFIQKAPPKAEDKSVQVDKVEVRAKRFYEVGPLPGLGLTKEEIPGNVQSISAQEIKEAHSLSITDLMNRKLQSVTVNDYQGNPFQMDVQYRGFTAGPQIGTPQGLSVFIDGIRVNEPFGDVVNWDMLPLNALASIDVFPGSNPIFGLNTLGGAFSLKTKDGFNNAGADVDILTGSFGRKQLQVEGGWNNGELALFGAGNFFLEDGWRQNSPSRVNQAFGKASYRGDRLDLNLSTLLVQTKLTGNGLLPNEMYAQDPTSIFTAPDKTDNNLAQFQLSGAFQATETFSITGQVYRRNSRRHQVGADAFMGIEDDALARRIPSSTEQYTCLFNSSANNKYGLPDYVVVSVSEADGYDFFSSPLVLDYFANGTADFSLGEFNQELPQYYVNAVTEQFTFWRNFYENKIYNRNTGVDGAAHGSAPDYSGTTFGGEESYFSGDLSLRRFPTAPGENIYFSDQNWYYSTVGGVNYKNFVIFTAPTNNANCLATQLRDKATMDGAFSYFAPNSNTIATVDGAGSGTGGVVYEVDPDTGKKYYIPTAIFTDNQIDQVTNGGSVQFNWNLDHHKFMVGASIDAADATYANKQRLGLLDAQRNAYLAPDDIHPMFVGADQWISNNDFSGTQTTKSIYFSETWSPVDNWHFSMSGRYNDTQTKNKIAARRGIGAYEIGDVIGYPDSYNICTDPACTGVSTQYTTPRITNALDSAETEKFKFNSFNPQLGASWQARPDLNIYANVAQGTRVPSVIELGCALDHRPSGVFQSDGNGNVYEVPKSIAENRQCTLPTTLSGDPYLPQIKATSYEVGMRGTWGENTQWNINAYQTDLKDDIYFVAISNGRGFFDTVGKTRRRGLEAGFKGNIDRLHWGLNYGLTDATFQDDFLMFSEDNSSSRTVNTLGEGVINVKPGDRMPGVSLHNLNASLSYDLTDNWNVGLTMVAHSDSFMRGNENNEHQVGVSRTFTAFRQVDDGSGNGTTMTEVYTRTLAPTTNPGKAPGYATFNLQSSYRFNKEWTATVLVTNLFDKEYFTAGRLGRNPFSPSVLGNIGPDGYNHNSADWRSTNFISPGAPRGVWFSLNWHFQPD